VAGLFFMKTQCEVEGCAGDHYAKALCRRHYERLCKGGDPHTPGRYERSPEERLKAKLGPKDPVTGCIEWVGYRNNDGYGMINRSGKMIGTHCLSYELKHGPIPKGLCVCHSCDNPACCNEEHLYLDTHAGNMADRDAKERSAKGESNGRAKLTEYDVVVIRRRLAAGETHRKIAAAFGVAQSAIDKIKTGRTWSHLKTNKT
jgi:hypothetical protein